jgi:sugar/nucleoside kinase (ribokinase family)
MNHPKVTVLGSANVDLVIRAERMPNKGETRIGETFNILQKTKVQYIAWHNMMRS